MHDARLFFGFWLVNSAMFYFAAMLAPDFVATGNARLTPFMASIISGFLLSLIDATVMPAFNALKIKMKSDWQWGLAFLFANILGVWLLARYADLSGVGIANAWAAVALGFVVNLVQWVLWKLVDSKSKNKF